MDLVAYLYALIVLVGGVVGFVKSGSQISLVVGLASGLLIGFGARQVSRHPKRFHVLLGTDYLNVFIEFSLTGNSLFYSH